MVAFTIGVALATGLAFGVVPAFVSTSHANEALRDGVGHARGRSVARWQSVNNLFPVLVWKQAVNEKKCCKFADSVNNFARNDKYINHNLNKNELICDNT